jgi:hypothetical protein
VNIIGPDFIFRFISIDHHVGSAAVAAVEDGDAVPKCCERFRLGLDAAHIAPSAGGERHPWTTITENLVVDVNATNLCKWHIVLRRQTLFE